MSAQSARTRQFLLSQSRLDRVRAMRTARFGRVRALDITSDLYSRAIFGRRSALALHSPVGSRRASSANLARDGSGYIRARARANWRRGAARARGGDGGGGGDDDDGGGERVRADVCSRCSLEKSSLASGWARRKIGNDGNCFGASFRGGSRAAANERAGEPR